MFNDNIFFFLWGTKLDAECRSVHQRLFDFIENTAFVSVPFKPTSRKSPYNCNLDSFEHHQAPQQFANVQVHVPLTPGFLSSRQNWVTPPSPLGSNGGRHTRLRVRGWGDPIPTKGQTLWYSMHTTIPLRSWSTSKMSSVWGRRRSVDNRNVWTSFLKRREICKYL